MKKLIFLATAFAVNTTNAYAGGMERSNQSIATIFESGTYVELSVAKVQPVISGSYLTSESGDMMSNYLQYSGAYKTDITNNLSAAFIIDQPFGAKTNYKNADADYPFASTTANVDSLEESVVLRYKINPNVSIHLGLRALQSSGDVSLPIYDYTMSTSSENDYGYLLGGTYEIPEIALRATLTYNSQFDIDFTTIENNTYEDKMTVTMPKSVSLDFQSGIAKDTLLMFSARWVKWKNTEINPTLWSTSYSSTALASYENNTVSYSLGLGYRFNEQWSGLLSYGYEEQQGAIAANLAPTDGYQKATAGIKYAISEETNLSGGASYYWIGDANTAGINAEFTDNNVLAFALKVSHHF
jgi:long-subunit fatty acid transport protein